MNRSHVQLYEDAFEQLRRVDKRGEYWLARELMPYAGYADWRNFQNAINRAKTALAGDASDVREHFSVIPPKTSDRGGRPRADIRLSRRGCYLIFMNGDPEKEPIAAAQNYFATKTRQMELAEEGIYQPPQEMPTHIQALRGWADALEAQERAEEEARRARAEAEELRPPAEAWRALAAAGGDCSVAEAAAILNRDPGITTGPARLFRWLKEIGLVYQRPNRQLVPYHRHMEHVRLRTTPTGTELRITPDGLVWIQQRMRQEQQRPALTVVPPVLAEVVPIERKS